MSTPEDPSPGVAAGIDPVEHAELLRQLRAELAWKLSPAGRAARRVPQQRALRAVVKAMQTAARPIAPRWEKASTGLVLRTDSGYGQVVARTPYLREDGEVSVRITAGSASKHLLKTWGRQDPNRAPNQHFVAVDAITLWEYEVQFAFHPRGDPAPTLCIPESQPGSEPVLCADTAAGWFASLLALVIPAVELTSTDAGLLDALLESAAASLYPQVDAMRNAVLLARQLGRPYDELLKRAEALEQQRVELWDREQPTPWQYRDRQTTYPQEWSHRRFVRFLESTASAAAATPGRRSRR